LYVQAILPRAGGNGTAAGAVGGERLPDLRMHLSGVRPTADQVARYCAVVGQPIGRELPLLYPHLLGFGLQMSLMSDRRFPFPLMGLVHLRNEVTVTRRPAVGEIFDLKVQVGTLASHPRGRTVDLVTVLRQDGEPLWTETSTYLRREPGGATPAPVKGETIASAGTPAGLSANATWRLAGDLGRRYAGVSGDLNPIHLHPFSARMFGFRRPIAHGMWTAAAVAAALEGEMPGELNYAVSFRRPIPLPSTVRLFTAAGRGVIHAEVRAELSDEVYLRAAVSGLGC